MLSAAASRVGTRHKGRVPTVFADIEGQNVNKPLVMVTCSPSAVPQTVFLWQTSFALAKPTDDRAADSSQVPLVFKWWVCLAEQNKSLKEIVQEKGKVGRVRKMSDKIPLLFHNNRNMVSQAPDTKAEKIKACSSVRHCLRDTHPLSRATSMNTLFTRSLSHFQRRKQHTPHNFQMSVPTETNSFTDKFYLPQT